MDLPVFFLEILEGTMVTQFIKPLNVFSKTDI